jgi:hypothetical protein
VILTKCAGVSSRSPAGDPIVKVPAEIGIIFIPTVLVVSAAWAAKARLNAAQMIDRLFMVFSVFMVLFFCSQHADRAAGLALHVSLKHSDNKRIYGFSFPDPVSEADVTEAPVTT